MKHKNIPLILLILFSAVTYNLYAQQKYWNEHTQLTPWRFPLTADKAGLTYEDLTGDGTPDIIRAFVLDSIPVMWIDDDGDMRYDDLEGDTDNDCLLIDLNKDGIFGGPKDLCIDWVDTDEDGIADMQLVIYNGSADARCGYDWDSDFIIVIDIEKDDIKSFIDWNQLLPLCWEHSGHSNFFQDYHGNTLLLKMHSSSFRVADTRFNCENPFIFYDHDNDNLTEMSVRLMDIPHVRPCNGDTPHETFRKVSDEIDVVYSGRIPWASISWDVDNDNGQGNEFDFDMTVHFYGKGFDYSDQIHKFKNLRGLPEADRYIYDPRWRQMSELIYPDEKVAYNMIFRKGKWDYCWFVFDEDDDCNRWERVEFYYPYDLFKVGAAQGGLDSHKQADAAGDRGEFDQDNSGKGRLYLSPIDGKIHLFGAEWGAWRIDQNAKCFQGYGGLYPPGEKEQRLHKDPESFATVKYTDTDNNGFFDLIEYDLNGDRIFEERVSLLELNIDDSGMIYDTSEMKYEDVKALFDICTNGMWERGQDAIEVAGQYNLNTSWYSFWKQPHTPFERYSYGYWLNFYIYKDLCHLAELNKDTKMRKRLDKAYYSGNWKEVLK